MLMIRDEQMKVFEQAALLRFEDEMVVHSQAFSPILTNVIGETQLRIALRSTIERAGTYGFTNRGPIRLYIELMFLFGSHFDTDPQYLDIAKPLNASEDQMWRAEQMHQGVHDYLENVHGSNDMNVRRALEYLSVFARKPVAFSSDSFDADMLKEITGSFPEKASYVGEERLTTIIHEGRSQARKFDFPTLRGEALMVVLMFAFGHGCTDDPLYPWIAATLNDERIISPEARAGRLEKKAMTWLDHVLARSGNGEQG